MPKALGGDSLDAPRSPSVNDTHDPSAAAAVPLVATPWRVREKKKGRLVRQRMHDASKRELHLRVHQPAYIARRNIQSR